MRFGRRRRTCRDPSPSIALRGSLTRQRRFKIAIVGRSGHPLRMKRGLHPVGATTFTGDPKAVHNPTVVNNQRRPGGMESRTSGLIDFGDSERMRAKGGPATPPDSKRRSPQSSTPSVASDRHEPEASLGNEHRIFSPGPPVTKLPAMLHSLPRRNPSCDRVCDVRGPGIDKVRPG